MKKIKGQFKYTLKTEPSQVEIEFDLSKTIERAIAVNLSMNLKLPLTRTEGTKAIIIFKVEDQLAERVRNELNQGEPNVKTDKRSSSSNKSSANPKSKPKKNESI